MDRLDNPIDNNNFTRDDVVSVIVKFKDGTEMLANDISGRLRCNTNDNGLGRYQPMKSWLDWEIRWSEHHEDS